MLVALWCGGAQLSCWLIVLLLGVFDVKGLSRGEPFHAVVALLALFGPASAAFCYVLSFAFR